MPTDPRILPSTMGGTTLGGTTSSLRLDASGECATKHPVQQSRARSKDERERFMVPRGCNTRANGREQQV